MIDDRLIDLVQADVDGELPEGRRGELAAYLLANPEARALQDELKRVRAALRAVPDVDPPPGLADSIMAAVPVPAAGMRRSRPRRWLQSGLLRYAAVFAGGLIGGALVFEASVDRSGPVQISEVAGTMVPDDASVRPAPVDKASFDFAQARGTVSLYATSSQRIVLFDVAMQEPVEIVVVHDGKRASFAGAAAPGAGAGDRFALALDGAGQPGGAIEVEFLAHGAVVHREILRVPASGS